MPRPKLLTRDLTPAWRRCRQVGVFYFLTRLGRAPRNLRRFQISKPPHSRALGSSKTGALHSRCSSRSGSCRAPPAKLGRTPPPWNFGIFIMTMGQTMLSVLVLLQ